ncbi:hypothetical protein IMSAGC019_01466 [Lachnospiraceae bacterium]|nr:hypothetical protein IMSAGC019_01466 [Lachnospiraceae bacterium]
MENMKKFTIMMRDTEVMKVDLGAMQYEVVQEQFLPYPIRGKLGVMPELGGTVSVAEMTQWMVLARKNEEAVVSWLANRVLPLSRANAKWIYNLCHFEQVGTDEQKVKIALACRAVSVLDPYWLKFEEDGELSWRQVNVRENPLNEILAQVALHGKSLTLQGSLVTPELTTNGAYAKAWRRHGDSLLWLYKLGANGNTESRIEVMCSGLLDKMNVEHVHYEAGEDEGKYVCMCPCMTTERKAILTGMEFISYCHVNGIDPDQRMFEIDGESIYKMWIVDFLISNRDRHGQNWGFFYDTETMGILGCHPLFDHNNAFDIDFMMDMDAPYQFGGMTIKQAAQKAMGQVDFHFTEPITREDFITERQYKSFQARVRCLGLKMEG